LFFYIKNINNILNFLTVAVLGCGLYFTWGIWALYVDYLVYDENSFNDDFIIKTLLGFLQAMILNMIACLVITSSFCCLEPLFRVCLLKKGKFNCFHVILLFLTIIPIFGLYIGCYYMEAYLQQKKIPVIFSNESLIYYLAGILKPLPVLLILGSALISDGINKKKEQTVNTYDSYVSTNI